MIRPLLAVAGCALLAPATAVAAPFGEPPPLAVGDTRGCLRATGAPGELARVVGSRVQFLHASPTGLTLGRSIKAGETEVECPRVAAWPSGAGVLATVERDAGLGPIRVHLRDPGGDWGPVTDVMDGVSPAVAVSERGDAAVAATRLGASVQIVVARRASGGAFGAPELIARADVDALSSLPIAKAAMSAAGEAIVAWAIGSPGKPWELWAASAAPGVRFGAPQRISTQVHGPFDVAVAADGRALLAFVDASGLRVSERAPGSRFAAPQRLAADALGSDVSVALRADGGAVVAWTGFYGGPVMAALRKRPGAFPAPVRIAGQPSLFDSFDPLVEGSVLYYLSAVDVALSEVLKTTGPGIRAAITGDGRALISWARVEGDRVQLATIPRSATIPLAGPPAEVRSHGPDIRGSGSLTPVELAGGTAAVAWTDPERGHVHLAVEGVPDGADPPAPRVRIGRPQRSRLRDGEPLVLPFRCSAACDVRAEVTSSGAVATRLLARAGRGVLTLQPLLRPIGRLRGGLVKVAIRAAAPGARRANRQTVSLRLRRVPGPKVRIFGLTARRRGSSVIVRWRTNRPSRQDVVYGLESRNASVPVTLNDPVSTGRSTRFRARLRSAHAVRWVVVLDDANGLASHMRRATARVRG